MEVKDLRLGNYVMNGDDIGRVDRLSIIRISTSSPHVGVEISPIKLTEEWLKNFEFKYMGNTVSDYKSFQKDELSGNLSVYIMKEGVSIWIETLRIDLKYVHQLQNLYFALTGKELELKPFVEEK